MKKIFTLLIGIIISSAFLCSQVPGSPPKGFSYKATIIKANGAIVAGKTISLRISILQGSTTGIPMHSEVFYPNTSEYGQIDIVIGEDGLPSLQWDQGPFYLKTEFDEKGGTNFLTMSITQLLSVPYALYSGSATTANETDPIFSSSPAFDYSPSLLINGNIAYGWGNHAIAGYLKNFTETDPLFSVSAANGITNTMISNWNTASGWGNHAAEGYATIDGVQTLTNKTLISPVINSPTGLFKANVGLGEVDNTPDLLKPISAATKAALELKESILTFQYPLSRAANIITLPVASDLSDGYMRIVDKTKLDGLHNADGSETIVTSGDNVTITGSGTSPNPYIVNAPGVITGSLNLSRVLSGGNDAGSVKISNLGDPEADHDAATKAYVDALESRITALETTVAGLITASADNDGDGYRVNEGDCNDNDLSIHPGATEICGDNKDNDCDGEMDEGCASNDQDGDGFTVAEGDCNDLDANVHPGATEIPGNDIDEDCNGFVSCFVDGDKDGYGSNSIAVNCYEATQGYSLGTDVCGLNNAYGYDDTSFDCNDANAGINPSAIEICDGKDNNCDGMVDEGCIVDADGDGYTANNGDCDDNDANVHPGAVEVCGDGIDQDCSGSDLACPGTVDGDGDGYTVAQGDCDDASAFVHPGGNEIIGDGIDQDCDGVDQTSLPSSFDWRSYNGSNWMTSVKYQGICGSDFAVATVAAFEAKIKIQSDRPELVIDLSEQEFLSCGLLYFNCDGGTAPSVLNYIRDNGIVEESVFPYSDRTPVPECISLEGQKKYKINGWETLPYSMDPNEIKKALINKGPIIFYTYVDVNIFGDYESGILFPPDTGSAISKTMLLIGYNDAERYWVVENTWGNWWGENGFYRLSYDATSYSMGYKYVINGVANN